MLILSGFLVGLLVGLTGVGGGALMTPLLLLVFGIAPVTAIGTDLWFAAITKIAAGKIHHSKGLIDWQVLRYMWVGSLPASLVMILCLHFKIISANVHFLTTLVAIAITVTAVSLLMQKYLHQLGRFLRLQNTERFKQWQPSLTILAGIILGSLVTLTSIGAGAIGVVMLTYLYPLRLTTPRLVATDIMHAIPLTVIAGTGHLLLGNINFDLLIWMLCGSIPGVLIGATISGKISQGILRIILAAVLILVAIKIAYS
ncbi:sulfite exporter TauE/SafE family protein [Polynucleobacter sp. JS-JIR-II-c23]|uniref:sulfite exporter TauE/SafE family protein n=1 Tax=Polynucleobacter sp. JS-JIR-II-c23 TaxID=1758393 RepID=UPI002B234B7A|nr:sulfite exporter TauE/SafE family protein [Polynucleobacter sp. JS-JIR-II-c23]MEA9603796.1 sulfite exporter TauE/SafE family protein [Polynucleobacter sp. JS-JIR-II-c23]